MHFVDTNVLVYARDETEPIKRDCARSILATLWRTGRGRTSHQVLVEFYATVTRTLRPGMPREAAMCDVRELQQWNPISPSPRLFELAWEIEDRWQLSWWDALIVAAAKLSDCTTLLSEDLQDGLDLDGLRVVNPFAPTFDLTSL